MHVLDRTRSFLQDAGLLGTRGIVAISGGPDSVALAHLLVRLLKQGALTGVVLAHVNHRLRGLESDGDAAFIGTLEQTWRCPGLTLQTLTVDTATKARGDNLEKVARELRYGWLAEIARREQVR